ncbi:MAG: hypothetical protein ACUVTE_01830 [Candidatus Bathycorpusculaceae bacterium]
MGGFLYENVSVTALFALCIPLDFVALFVILFKIEEPAKREA